jgi:hypothetical protein
MGDWIMAVWCIGWGAIGLRLRKGQDQTKWASWFRERFGLDAHYYERVTVWVSAAFILIGLGALARALA